MVNLISSWLGGAIASGAGAKEPIRDEEPVKGLPQVLAEILANLQTTFAGTPLDVEISYEGGNKVRAPLSTFPYTMNAATTFLTGLHLLSPPSTKSLTGPVIVCFSTQG